MLVKQQAQAQLPAAQSPLVSTPAQQGASRQLQAAVRELERGGSLTAPISSDPPGDLGGAEALTARPEPPKLTNRERSVLELVAEGKLNREIASEIGITTRVVETYVRRLLAKTGTSNRTQLLRRALQIGLLSPDPPYQYM